MAFYLLLLEIKEECCGWHSIRWDYSLELASLDYSYNQKKKLMDGYTLGIIMEMV